MLGWFGAQNLRRLGSFCFHTPHSRGSQLLCRKTQEDPLRWGSPQEVLGDLLPTPHNRNKELLYCIMFRVWKQKDLGRKVAFLHTRERNLSFDRQSSSPCVRVFLPSRNFERILTLFHCTSPSLFSPLPCPLELPYVSPSPGDLLCYVLFSSLYQNPTLLPNQCKVEPLRKVSHKCSSPSEGSFFPLTSISIAILEQKIDLAISHFVTSFLLLSLKLIWKFILI